MFRVFSALGQSFEHYLLTSVWDPRTKKSILLMEIRNILDLGRCSTHNCTRVYEEPGQLPRKRNPASAPTGEVNSEQKIMKLHLMHAILSRRPFLSNLFAEVYGAVGTLSGVTSMLGARLLSFVWVPSSLSTQIL